MTEIKVSPGPFELEARFERKAAPGTTGLFESLLPNRQNIIHLRWSGEGCWIPGSATRTSASPWRTLPPILGPAI